MLALLSTVAGLGRAIRHRREILALADLDDRLLGDIGLRRADVHTALAQPPHRDPSQVLKDACCQGLSLVERFRRAFAPVPVPCC